MIKRHFLHFLRTLGAVAGMAAIVAGCADDGVGLDAMRDLARNKARWEAVGPGSYAYAMGRLCFCPTEYRGPVRITVEDGIAIDRVFVETGEPVPADIAPEFPTGDAMQGGAYRVDVTYDPDLGMPVEFWIDHRENVADDEIGMTVSEAVTPIP